MDNMLVKILLNESFWLSFVFMLTNSFVVLLDIPVNGVNLGPVLGYW